MNWGAARQAGVAVGRGAGHLDLTSMQPSLQMISFMLHCPMVTSPASCVQFVWMEWAWDGQARLPG